MTCGRMLAFSVGCSALLWVISWPSTPARAQVLERGVEGAAVGAIIGGIVGGGKGAARGAGIGAGIGALSGAAEANARAQDITGRHLAMATPSTTVRLAMARDVMVIPGRQILLPCSVTSRSCRGLDQ